MTCTRWPIARAISSARISRSHSREVRTYHVFKSIEEFADIKGDIHGVFKAKYGDDFPSPAELNSNVAYALCNTEPLLDFGAPTVQRVIMIPGLGARDPQPLDDHFKEILGRRPQTILISFGSVAQSFMMPQRSKDGILGVSFPHISHK